MLKGEAFDLEDWQDALKPPFEPWVMKTEVGLILRSSQLDGGATASAAFERAKALMDEVNGALRASGRTGIVRFEDVAEVFSDGACRRHVIASIASVWRMRSRAVATVLGADGKPYPESPPQLSEPQRWLSVAAEDDLLADALIYFARCDDWFDVYKALECLFARFGGGDEKNFLALGWADPDKIKLLKRTADVERHSRRGRPGVVPPPQPMERTEARELLAKLMAHAFHEAPITKSPPPERSAGDAKLS